MRTSPTLFVAIATMGIACEEAPPSPDAGIVVDAGGARDPADAGPSDDAGASDAGAVGDCVPDARPNSDVVESAGAAGCPAGTVPVADEAFCVDAHEAFLVEVLPDDTEAPWSPYQNPGTTRVRAKSAAGAVPQAYIDQTQAAAACLEAGKRLCTDDEWQRACRGPASSTYPYGDEREAGACNDERGMHPAVELYEGPDGLMHLDDPCIDQLPDTLDVSGANAACVSSDEAFDLVGNLLEWTADPAGTLRGGFFVDSVINGAGCLYLTTAHDVEHWDYASGFRCCADGDEG